MPMLMSLEGLNATTPPPPVPLVTPPATVFAALVAHPVWLFLGVFGGMWLAGSKTGQGFWKKK